MIVGRINQSGKRCHPFDRPSQLFPSRTAAFLHCINHSPGSIAQNSTIIAAKVGSGSPALHYLIDDPEPAAGETLVLSYSPNWPFPSQQATVGQQMIGGDPHQQEMQQAYGNDIEPVKLLCVEQRKQQDREQV
jgi:hypothetical protein